MFTGIITHVGAVRDIDRSRGDWRIWIESSFDAESIPTGASICCSGCCLTVVGADNGAFAVDVSAETLSKTVIGGWEARTKVNLERSLKIGDELGGHLVSGHVDGLARLLSIMPDGDSRRLSFRVPGDLIKFIAPKGSVALGGISLTVNEVEGDRFGVNIIPHTWNYTSLREMKPGDPINLEIDMLARYVARILGRDA
ncbi:MAG: riboflavin synthase [Alphaproteobacteria bacterium]|nr:riboflavin synthase [Alphaproteobacteria bacterium]